MRLFLHKKKIVFLCLENEKNEKIIYLITGVLY